MKKSCILAAVFLFACGLFSVHAQDSVEKIYAIDTEKFHFSIAADPSGLLMYGPFVLTEFTKNHFNASLYVSLPSLGLLSKADGFGIGGGGSINYLWHTRTGAFYLGVLFDYSGYKIHLSGLIPMPNGTYTDGKYDYTDEDLWQSKYAGALNLGYKFVLSSGIYFNVGGNAGATISDDIRSHETKVGFFVRPNISMGYMF